VNKTRFKNAARRLDFLPTRWAWALGLAFGVLAGAALAGPVPGALGAAWVLAWSGEPVAVVESARKEPESETGEAGNPDHMDWSFPIVAAPLLSPDSP
jgi:hypothetical protein